MYKHHQESIEIMRDYFAQKPEVIAVVLGGSVPKNCARPDSDIDGMVIITEEAYEQRKKTNTTTETIHGMCTYDEGYFDIKYMTKDYLIDAAKRANEPTRNSFVSSQVLYTIDDSIPEIIAQIEVFQESEYEDKMLSFHSNFWLNYYYFWKSCPIDGFMKLHVVNEIIYSVYRMILQQNKILFPSNRRLEDFVADAKNKPEQIIELAATFITNMDDPSCDAFVNAYLDWTTYNAPEDVSQILTRYTSDYEQWWRVPRPLVGEW